MSRLGGTKKYLTEDGKIDYEWLEEIRELSRKKAREAKEKPVDAIGGLKRTKPMSRRRFRWHRFMMMLRHPFSFKRRRWDFDYIEEKDRWRNRGK